MIEGQESFGKATRLTYGMVGGGQGAFIGDVHRKAIAMDGMAGLVGRMLLRSPTRTPWKTGEAWGVDGSPLQNLRGDDRRRSQAPGQARFRPHRHAERHPLPDRPARPRERLPRRLRQAADDERPGRRGARPPGQGQRNGSSASPTPTPATRSSSTCGRWSTNGELGDIRFVTGGIPPGLAGDAPREDRARSRPPGGPTPSAPASRTASATSAATSRTWSRT